MELEDPESSDPKPTLFGQCKPCGICFKTCPGKTVPFAALEEVAFGRSRRADESVGVVRSCHRAWAAHEDLRRGASSGGAVTAVMAYGLASGALDGVLLAVRNEEMPWRCRGGIVCRPEDAALGVRSVMEPVPTLEVLSEAVARRGLESVGVVGLPCQMHALRKLQTGKTSPKLARAVKLMVGVFCNSAKAFIDRKSVV